MARLTFVSENEGKMPSYVAVRSEKEEAPRQEKKFSKVLDLLGMAFDILTTVFVVGCASFGLMILLFVAFMRVHAI
jgi:hypothetical protein